MTTKRNQIAIGVLAYNEEVYLQSVLEQLEKLNLDIYIVNDCSTDSTGIILSKFEDNKNISIINNKKNFGAGESTRILIECAKNNSKDFLIKVDGDGQFSISDVEKIIDLYINKNYEFIKSNRFWREGIVGKIPKIRFFGNIFATLLMQVASGTNKLYDPLNGLFGVSTNILNALNTRFYPKRYGYPYFITVAAVLHNFKTFQINNVVSYRDEKSNLNSIKVFFTLLKLTILFYLNKLKSKKIEAKLQRSAFFDYLFIFSFGLLLNTLIYFILITFILEKSFIRSSNLLLVIIFLFVTTIYFFSKAFNEEIKFRNSLIKIETIN